MQRYQVTVCTNCGTEYNSVRPVCPGFQCGEETPDVAAPDFVRKFRTGPVISNPDQVEAGAGTEIADPVPQGDEAADDDEE